MDPKNIFNLFKKHLGISLIIFLFIQMLTDLAAFAGSRHAPLRSAWPTAPAFPHGGQPHDRQ